MPLLGLYLQHKDGTNLLMHTKCNWNLKLAYQVAQDVATQLAQLRKEDFGPMGLRNTEPHFAAGRVVSLSFYQVAYELLTDVYVAVVQHVDDNPFYSDTMLQRAKTAILTVCRSERCNCEEIQKKHGEIWTALEAVLDHSRSDVPDDWASVERKSIEARDVLDSLFAIDFTIPVDLMPEARPQQFGAVFGEVANKGTPKSSRRTAAPSTASGLVSSSGSSSHGKRTSGGSSRKGKLRPSATAGSATSDVVGTNTSGRKLTSRSSSGLSKGTSGHRDKTSPRKVKGSSSRSSSSANRAPSSTVSDLSSHRDAAPNTEKSSTELSASSSSLSSAETPINATGIPSPMTPAKDVEKTGAEEPSKPLTVEVNTSVGNMRIPSPLASPLPVEQDQQTSGYTTGTGLPPLPIGFSIETVDEGDELDSSREPLSDSDSDSDEPLPDDEHDENDGFESPRLDSPTGSDDEDENDDDDDDLASESLNDDSLHIGDENGPSHLRVHISSHDRTYSSGVDSDLATTPRTDGIL